MQLSVIIPVYKVEHTLRRCVESVLGQLPPQSEVILVDDGSPDACPALCDAWAQTDPRVLVVHQANGGLSAARNTGIEKARGEWLTFVDSDDWLEPDTLSAVLAEAMKDADCDMVEYPVQVYEGGRDERLLELQPWEGANAVDYWLTQRGYAHAYAWNKLYRRTLFTSVRYPVGQVFEDVPTTWQLLQHARKLRITNRGLYHYTSNPQGITLTADGAMLSCLLQAHADIFAQLRSHRSMDMPMQRYYLHIVNIQLTVYRLGLRQLVLPNEALSWNCLTDTQLPWTSRLKAAFLKLFSLKDLCQFVQTLHNIRHARF